MRHLLRDGNKKNPALVLLHAFPLDHKVWQPQVQFLSKDHWVITPDLRGHGQSEATTEPYSMDLLAKDVKALIENLDAKNIVLGGISLGGYVAMAFARLFTKDLQALVLADSKMEGDSRQARQQRMHQADLVLMKGVSSFADQMLPRLFSKTKLESNDPIIQESRKTIEAMSPMGIVGALQGMAERADSAPLLESIRIPSLVIVGQNDQVTTVEDATRMAGKILDSKLTIIPDAAHIATLEQPGRVTSAMQFFLRGVSAARQASRA